MTEKTLSQPFNSPAQNQQSAQYLSSGLPVVSATLSFMRVIPAVSYGLITRYRPCLSLTALPRLCPSKRPLPSISDPQFVWISSGFCSLVAGQSSLLSERAVFGSDCSAYFRNASFSWGESNYSVILRHFWGKSLKELADNQINHRVI